VTERDPLLDIPVRSLLDELAASARSPGSGAVSALVASFSAALVEAAAAEWAEGENAAARARVLRERVAELAQENAEAFRAARASLHDLPGELRGAERDLVLGVTLRHAADVPLAIAEAACELATLGALVAERGHPRQRPDAVAATLLAGAAAVAAAKLVSVNLLVTPGDERDAHADELATAAAHALERALKSALKP
jgi:formiminotetrahydrofolate cyclodeaminase